MSPRRSAPRCRKGRVQHSIQRQRQRVDRSTRAIASVIHVCLVIQGPGPRRADLDLSVTVLRGLATQQRAQMRSAVTQRERIQRRTHAAPQVFR